MGVLLRDHEKEFEYFKDVYWGYLITKLHIYLSISYILNGYKPTKMSFQLKNPCCTFQN